MVELGSLWDCRESKYSGFNLFSSLQKDNVTCNSMSDGQFDLKHFKSTNDKVGLYLFYFIYLII